MNYDPWKELARLFKKHMRIPNPYTPHIKVDDDPNSDSSFQAFIHHQFEYIALRHIDGIIYICNTNYTKIQKRPTLLQLFYNQEDRLDIIERKLNKYCSKVHKELISKIITAIEKMKSKNVPPYKIFLKEPYAELVGHNLFGLKVHSIANNLTQCVQSSEHYGRFVVI